MSGAATLVLFRCNAMTCSASPTIRPMAHSRVQCSRCKQHETENSSSATNVFYLAFRPFAGYKSCEHRIYKMDSDFAANFKFGARTPLYMRLNHILKDGQYDRDVVGWLIVGWLVSSPS